LRYLFGQKAAAPFVTGTVTSSSGNTVLPPTGTSFAWKEIKEIALAFHCQNSRNIQHTIAIHTANNK
jgi:hypothetical protein